MGKVNLTDRFIKSRKPAGAGKRDEFLDGLVPGLALRVTDSGHKSFVLVQRFPLKPKNPTRRTLGVYGQLTLESAREKARHWHSLIGRGIDPRIEEERQRAAQQLGQANTFDVVANAFLDRSASTLAKSAEARSIITKEFIQKWRNRPASEILPREAAEAVRAIAARGAPYQAYNAFGWLRRLFNWAISTGEFGLSASPVSKLSASDIIGVRREPRSRILSDQELRWVWSAASKLDYPYGPLFQMLVVTGQREREVADATWDEFDLETDLWTIPKARMKGDRPHEVPLSKTAVLILKTLPRWTRGEHIFSSNDGTKPLNGFSKAKARLDKLVAAERAKSAGLAADADHNVPPWVLHDIRRTVRTHLSALPVQDMIRELVIAHARPGLHKVYDQHTYREEKRECLLLWDSRLHRVLNPKEGLVTDLHREMRRASA